VLVTLTEMCELLFREVHLTFSPLGTGKLRIPTNLWATGRLVTGIPRDCLLI